MAALDTRAEGFGTPARFAGFGGNLMAGFLAWRDRRATRNALAKLSDHELEDIGLSRGDIDTIVR